MDWLKMKTKHSFADFVNFYFSGVACDICYEPINPPSSGLWGDAYLPVDEYPLIGCPDVIHFECKPE